MTVKYNVMLGLPEALPPSVLSADAGDRKGDGGDAAAKAEVGTDMVSAFRGRIRQCSKLPASLAPSDDLFVKMRILMTPDGRLAAEPIAKEGSASLKAIDLKEAAVAALSACQPYTMLPPEKYSEWKVIDLTFTPRDFNSCLARVICRPLSHAPIARQALEANCRRQVTTTTSAVVKNSTHGLTNQPR